MLKILDTLTTAVVLVVALGAGWTMYAKRPQPRATTPIPTAPVPMQGLPALGRADAPYAILEFSDFECPYCGTFARETFPALKAALIDTGKVRFVFANFPLPFHKSARPAAEAAICSPDFFQTAEMLFGQQEKLADVLKLVPRSSTPSDDGVAMECAGAVDASLALGKTLKVSGTPAFFIGTMSGTSLTVKSVIPGVASLDAFTKEIQ